jgi:hypothetical protein
VEPADWWPIQRMELTPESINAGINTEILSVAVSTQKFTKIIIINISRFILPRSLAILPLQGYLIT